MNHKFGLALAGLTLGAAAFAQTKWDLPTAYPATNYHTENITQFSKEVDAATGGKLKVTVHANASLFKAPEIKRAVQSGQAQAGEILLANFANENPIEFTLRPGMMMFIPKYHWHEVYTLSASISITYNFVHTSDVTRQWVRDRYAMQVGA